MSSKLKEMEAAWLKGIIDWRKNVVRIVNPELVGVNPFDPNLSLETRAAIWTESCVNPAYFFQIVLQIPESEIAEIDNLVVSFVRNPPVWGQQTEQTEKSVLHDLHNDLIARSITDNVKPGISSDNRGILRRLAGIELSKAEPRLPMPEELVDKAKAASNIWQEILAEGEIGRTNAQVEHRFQQLVVHYYDEEFLRVKVEGLTASVSYKLPNGEWAAL